MAEKDCNEVNTKSQAQAYDFSLPTLLKIDTEEKNILEKMEKETRIDSLQIQLNECRNELAEIQTKLENAQRTIDGLDQKIRWKRKFPCVDGVSPSPKKRDNNNYSLFHKRNSIVAKKLHPSCNYGSSQITGFWWHALPSD